MPLRRYRALTGLKSPLSFRGTIYTLTPKGRSSIAELMGTVGDLNDDEPDDDSEDNRPNVDESGD